MNLVTAHSTEVVTLGVKEKSFDEGAGVGRSGRIARPEAAINILQRLFFVLGRILFENLDDDAVIGRGVRRRFTFLTPSSAICLTTALESGSKARATTMPFSASIASSTRTLFWISSSFPASFRLSGLDFVEEFEHVHIRAAESCLFSFSYPGSRKLNARNSVVVRNFRRRFLRSR